MSARPQPSHTGPLPGQRQILSQGRWPVAGFFSATQDIKQGTEWAIHRGLDTVIVHLGGPIAKLETELDGAGTAFDPPMPGEIWVVPENRRYLTQARGGLVHYAELHFDRSVVNGLAGKQVVKRPLRARAGHFDGFLQRTVLRLEALAGSSDDLSQMAAQSLSQTLLLDFYCRYAGDADLTPVSRRVRFSAREASLIEQFVAEHLDSQLRLETLAALVTMTPHELLIAFRAAFGATPAQYIIEQRLRRARWLLLTTAKSVAAIAYETGFSSHAHLTTAFRTRLQMTPQEFRQSQRVCMEPK